MKTDSMRITSPVPREQWMEIITHDPNALISHTPEWIDSICQEGLYEDASRLFELSNGRRIVFPAVRYKNLPIFLNGEKSLPHGWGFGGLTASGGVTAEEINQVISSISAQPGLRTSIRPNPLQVSYWNLSVPSSVHSRHHSTHILSLEGGFEHVWAKRFSSATRNKIRKAEQSGLTIEKDNTGSMLPEFYQLYLDWSERRARERHFPVPISRWLAKMREPVRKFQAVIDHFGTGSRLWVARLGNRTVAAAFLLVWGEHALYWRSASDKELTLQTRANDLLQKLMIEDACQSGCRYYHMGESGGVVSLMHFKARFGAVEYPYDEYFLGHSFMNGFLGKLNGFAHPIDQARQAQNRKRAHETRSDD